MLSSFYTALALHAALSSAAPLVTGLDNCKVIPGDKKWPSMQTWAHLNQTVGGRLIATTPIAEVCHVPNFDTTQCTKLSSKWGVASLVWVSLSVRASYSKLTNRFFKCSYTSRVYVYLVPKQHMHAFWRLVSTVRPW